MYTKLTLNITEAVVAKAKRVAKRRKTSVSRLVEDFLNKISEEKETSIVQSIIDNAPVKKTVPGTEKSIITAYLKKNMAIKVFVDTNIVIDFIEQRSFDKDALIELFNLAEKNKIDVFISESVITTTIYVTKNTKQLERLLKIVRVICIPLADIKLALSSSFKDKEDAILYFGALNEKLEYFITRDTKDFLNHTVAQLPVMHASAFLKLIL